MNLAQKTTTAAIAVNAATAETNAATAAAAPDAKTDFYFKEVT